MTRALAIVPLLLLLAWLALVRPLTALDTRLVVQGAATSLACLRKGRLTGCPEVSYFPLLQYLPAALALRIGWDAAIPVLALVNVGAFAVTLLMAAGLARRFGSAGMWRLAFVALVAGPQLVYAVSTFGEGLAAAVVLAACTSVVLGARGWLQALAFAGAALTKETAAVGLVLLAVASFLIVRERLGRLPRRAWLAPAVGLGIGTVCNLLFNVFRFGSPLNERYADPSMVVPSVGLWLDFAAANLVAPNAGLLFFWPSALSIVIGCAAAVVAARATRWRVASAVAVVLSLVALLAEFGSWCSPFGWNAWGPRLLVPWMPSLCLLALAAAREQVDAFGTRLAAIATPRGAAWLATLVTIVLALPVAGHLADQAALDSFFQFGDAACPRVPELGDWPYYYACIRHYAWARTPWVVLDAARGAATPLGLELLACVALATRAALAPRAPVDLHRAGRHAIRSPDRV